jgi:hypothetical protein
VYKRLETAPSQASKTYKKSFRVHTLFITTSNTAKAGKDIAALVAENDSCNES